MAFGQNDQQQQQKHNKIRVAEEYAEITVLRWLTVLKAGSFNLQTH